MTPLSIVTPWHGRPDLIAGYEQAVVGAQVILVDNASDAATAAALQTLAARLGNGSLYLRNERNRGFSVANNQGYALTTADTILFLNSDVTGPPRWWEVLVKAAVPDALVGPSTSAQLVWGWWLQYVDGWCIAARRETWERVRDPETKTIWDEQYPFYWEDMDLSFRAQRSGLKTVEMPPRSLAVRHLGGQSVGDLSRWGEEFEAGRARFAGKVGQIWRKLAHEARARHAQTTPPAAR
jgi:GT2 family glycosyltransferase